MRKMIVFVSVILVFISLGLFVQPITATEPCTEPTKIILIRHGQTHWNVLGLLQGNADVPLDETGLEQAQALKDAIAGKDVDAVYSSPLSRAYDTATAIASPHGMRVHKNGRFREIGVGIYTGYLSIQIPEDIRITWATNPEFAMPSGVPDTTDLLDPSYVEGIWFEGESLNMVSERSWHAGIRNLARQHCGENIIVVTHGGIIQIVLTQVYVLPVTQYRSFKVPNASQTVLKFEPDGSVLVVPSW